MGFYRLYLYVVLCHCDYTCMDFFQGRMHNVIKGSVFIFLSLSVIPVLDRTVIACNTAVYLSLFAAFRTGKVLAT